jgi:hypothetical protein
MCKHVLQLSVKEFYYYSNVPLFTRAIVILACFSAVLTTLSEKTIRLEPESRP